MAISLTTEEARALRDALRTDYSLREEIVKMYNESEESEEAAQEVVADAKKRLALLENVDMILQTVYQYPEESKK